MVFTEVSSLMESERDMELSNGTMVRSFKDCGRMEPRMGLEYGNLPRGTFMKESGVSIVNMEKGFISID